MNAPDKYKEIFEAEKPREPLYASIWVALFTDLRREFALARNAS